MKDFVLRLKELDKSREIEKLHALIAERVQQENNNIEWLLRLAIVLLDRPFSDEFTSLELAEKVLLLEPQNVNALLIMVYIHHYCLGGVSEQHLQKINSIQTGNNEEKSVFAYVTSWFYQDHRDPAGEKQWLLESIKLCDKHVWNHWRLAELYVEENRLDDAKKHMQRALSNIVKVYSDTYDNCDETDVKEFIDAHIKGIYQEKVTIESFQKDLDKLSKLSDA